MKSVSARMPEDMIIVVRAIPKGKLIQWLEKEYTRREEHVKEHGAMPVFTIRVPDELAKKLKNKQLVPDLSAFIREAVLRNI